MTGSQPERRRIRPLIVAVSGITLVAVLGVILFVLGPGSSGDEPSAGGSIGTQEPADPPSTTEEPSTPGPSDPGSVAPDPTPSDDPADPTPSSPGASGGSGAAVVTQSPITEDGAEKVVVSYLSAVSELEPDAANVSAQVGGIAGEDLIEEAEADLLELESNGWQRTGAPVVVSVTVTEQEKDAAPPTATVEACIDSSDVQVLDASGEPLPKDPGAARALNIYHLVQNDDGSWIVASRTFPSNPSC